jgi:hypothetical protein
MQELDMDDAHQAVAGVHFQRSVKRQLKTTTPCYITIIQTNNCKKTP